MGFTIPSGVPLSQIPAMRPPHGVVSNFDSPETSAGPLRVLNGLFPALALIMVMVRVYSRVIARENQKFSWDDGFCVFAMLGSIIHTVIMYLSIKYGYGHHLWDIRAMALTTDRTRIQTLNDEFYIITIFSIKISILLLYKRLFGVYESSRQLVFIGFIVNTMVAIPYMAVSIGRTVQCNGLGALKHSFCLSHAVSTTVTVFGTLNMVTDFYTLIIPVNRVLRLHMDRKKKIGLLAIFLAGLAACLMSLVRLVIVITNFNDVDGMWNAAKISPYTVVEINLAIICSCMMFVPAVARKLKGLKKGSPSAGSAIELAPTIPEAYHVMKGSPKFSRHEEVATKEKRLKDEQSWEQNIPDMAFLTDLDESVVKITPPASV